MKVSVAGAASGIMGVAAGGGSAIGLGGHRDALYLLSGPFTFDGLSLIIPSQQGRCRCVDGMEYSTPRILN